VPDNGSRLVSWQLTANEALKLLFGRVMNLARSQAG